MITPHNPQTVSQLQVDDGDTSLLQHLFSLNRPAMRLMEYPKKRMIYSISEYTYYIYIYIVCKIYVCNIHICIIIYICNIYKSYESSQEVPLHLLQPRGSSEQLAAMQPGCNVDTFAPTHPGVPKVNPPSPPVPGGEGHLCDEANTSWNKPWAQRGGGMDFLPLGYIGLLKEKKNDIKWLQNVVECWLAQGAVDCWKKHQFWRSISITHANTECKSKPLNPCQTPKRPIKFMWFWFDSDSFAAFTSYICKSSLNEVQFCHTLKAHRRTKHSWNLGSWPPRDKKGHHQRPTR